MTILARLAEGSAVSETASDEMLGVLRGQKFNEGIPAGLPPGTPVAHKTGSFRGSTTTPAWSSRPAGSRSSWSS